MKYIEIPSLSRLAQSLSYQGPECDVNVRIEAYSCKNIKRDKRLFRELEKGYWGEIGILGSMKWDPDGDDDVLDHSPPTSYLAQAHSTSPTPFGPLGHPQSRKTLYLLIATLNVAFPDYEFSDVKPSSFVREESGASVLNHLSTTLIDSHTSRGGGGSYGSYPTPHEVKPAESSTSSSPYERMRQSPYAPPPIVSGTHPEVYRLLDEVIGLSECEVYSYEPDGDADPNWGEDEDDLEEEEEQDGESDDDGATFQLDEDMRVPYPRRANTLTMHLNDSFSPYSKSYRPTFSTLSSSSSSRHGALLWSTHWFFLNRKQKRILFVSIWAKARRSSISTYADFEAPRLLSSRQMAHNFIDSDESEYSPIEDRVHRKESFLGWNGAVGAGARAMGLSH